MKFNNINKIITIFNKKNKIKNKFNGIIYNEVIKLLINNNIIKLNELYIYSICRENSYPIKDQENNVKIGTWVLLGLREWETTVSNKKDKCDLLEVYREDDKKKIMQRD